KVDTEFQSAWGFPISPASRDVPWARDMDRIFGALGVVDNWNYATWQLASASNGALGAGLGVPRVSWAPDFGGILHATLPPASPASLSQIAGTPAGGGYLSPATVTLTASDATSGVQSISYRVDGGAQWTYSAPFRVAGNGTHVVEYHAIDQAGNSEAVHTLSI